jgi:hypothetical protein
MVIFLPSWVLKSTMTSARSPGARRSLLTLTGASRRPPSVHLFDGRVVEEQTATATD